MFLPDSVHGPGGTPLAQIRVAIDDMPVQGGLSTLDVNSQWLRYRYAGAETTSVGVGRLDDEDYPAVTMGQAAELLGVQPAFLRSLDAADVLNPVRSAGGHRRYSRRQLEFAARMRELFDEGVTLEAAHRILRLEDELQVARDRITELEQPSE